MALTSQFQVGSKTEDKTTEKFTPKERSVGFLIFLIILIASGNYFFGYQLAIFNVVSDPLLKGVFKKDEDG